MRNRRQLGSEHRQWFRRRPPIHASTLIFHLAVLRWRRLRPPPMGRLEGTANRHRRESLGLIRLACLAGMLTKVWMDLMKVRKYFSPTFCLPLLAAGGWMGVSGAESRPASTTSSSGSASLHSPHQGASNPGFTEGDCPSVGYGWHFVLPGNDSAFVTITARFDHAGTVTDFESYPTSKHGYIYTPGPDTLLGAEATVTGTAERFVLSHVCTPSTTTTTIPSTTTTTIPSTMTTIPTFTG